MFLTVVEDKSKATWIFLLPYKAQVGSNIKDFMAYVQTQFATTIKVIRSDNRSEFLNKDLQARFVEKEVIHQTTYVCTPQQNGLVERKYRSLLNVARALHFHSHVHLWSFYLRTTAYILSRTTSHSFNGLSPYEVLFKKVPNNCELKVFGCLCFANVEPQSTDKFAPRAIKGVFVGYQFATKGYRILEISSQKVFISRDVTFYESFVSVSGCHYANYL